MTEDRTGEERDPRPPGRQLMFESVSRVVPHLRVGGTESGRGAGESGGADVGTYTHRPATRHALAGSGGGFVGGAYLSDEEHSPVLFGVLFDA